MHGEIRRQNSGVVQMLCDVCDVDEPLSVPPSYIKQNHHILQLQAKCRRMKKMSEPGLLTPTNL
jgi:hypothetical protein